MNPLRPVSASSLLRSRASIVGAIVFLGSMGCGAPGDGEDSLTEGDEPRILANAREADSERPYAWVETPRGMRLMPYEIIDGHAIAEGDIIIGRADEVEPASPDEMAEPPLISKGAYRVDGLWPNATVRYATASLLFNLSATQQQQVLAAMQIWTDKTGIRFEGVGGRTVSGDYIAFFAGEECSSYVGRVGGGQQALFLSPSCSSVRTAVHELGHAIGLYHEQSRSDRDSYVAVYSAHIDPEDYTRNYLPWDEEGLNGFDVPAWPACSLPAYDFDSCMHYSSRGGAEGDWPAMLRIAESTLSGPQKRIYKHTGLDVWTPLTVTAYSNHVLGHGLFDANAKTDLFRSGGGSWFISPDSLRSWTLLRSANEVYRKSRTATTLLLGDFNGNGRTDAMRETNGVWQVSWNATGGWTTLHADARLNGVIKKPSDLGTGDFNGDAKTDILAESGGNWYVRYGGQGSWSLYADLTTNLPAPWQVGYGDFNGDHITDVFRVTASGWELLVVNPLFGASWQVFGPSQEGPLHQSLSHGDWRHSIALVDYNGDGLTDVLGTLGPRLRVSLTALGTFLEPRIDFISGLGGSLTPLHFNNFNFNFVHTCKTVETGSYAGQKRCHTGPDSDGDGRTDILSSQVALPLTPSAPTLSAGDITAACHHYAIASCFGSCPTPVP